MPKPYSLDLRTRVVEACLNGMTRREAAELFQVGEASVNRWATLLRVTRSVAPKPHAGGPAPTLDAEGMRALKEVVESGPDQTLDEIARSLASSKGYTVSVSTVRLALARLGMTRKKRR